MPTLHNAAQKGDFAPTVLMPGDPLRAKFIADTYLDHARLVNNVRGIQGYTGEYKGKSVSVMASGMGMPSIGIYSHELYTSYDVQNIIRVGSAGMISPQLKIRSVVAAMSAYSNSNYGAQFGFRGNLAPCCSYALLEKAVAAARSMGVPMPVGPVYSSDIFYDETEPKPAAVLKDLGVLCVEMETYALYLNAARAGKNALALLTISDNVFTGESLSPQEVRETFTQMMEIALEIA
ncbi:MAG: purine-nucleoside phosphorylase [Clostridiales bacterium]|nr:purine-nucleoside phosphorylase [Clostridiales bacterium]